MPEGRSWWTFRRLWLAVAVAVVVFAADIVSTNVTFLALYVVPLVGSAVIGSPRITIGVGVWVMALAVSGALLKDYSAQDLVRRVLVIAMTTAISAYLARHVGRTQGELARQRDLYRLLAENSSDVVARGRDGILVWVSDSVTKLLGWAPADLVGMSFSDLIRDDCRSLLLAQIARVDTGGVGQLEVPLLTAAGGYRWVDIQLRPEVDADGAVVGLVAGWRDAQAVYDARLSLTRQANHDNLTGALNRAAVIARLGGTPAVSGDDDSGALALIYCDIDNFKEVNDSLGHRAGDELLRNVVASCRSVIRDSDTIARFGGDEFLVVLEGVHGLGDAEAIAEAIRRSVDTPLTLANARIRPSLSMGVTLRRDGEPIDAVIARADRAMYTAKRGGRNAVVALA